MRGVNLLNITLIHWNHMPNLMNLLISFLNYLYVNNFLVFIVLANIIANGLLCIEFYHKINKFCLCIKNYM